MNAEREHFNLQTEMTSNEEILIYQFRNEIDRKKNARMRTRSRRFSQQQQLCIDHVCETLADDICQMIRPIRHLAPRVLQIFIIF